MDIRYRLATENDKEPVLNLLNEVFNDQQRSSFIRDERYWNWKFIDSPYGKAVLTVAELNQEIIGVDNLWPWEFRFKDKILRAYQPCDSVVHSKFRGQGIFKNMRLHGLDNVRENSPAFLFNFPNSQSINANLSLGWYSLGQIPWQVKVIKPISFLRGVFAERRTHPFRDNNSGSIDVEKLAELVRVNINVDNFIRPNRKQGYFNWRYLQHPSRQYTMIFLDQGIQSAAAIFTINQTSCYKEMFLVEMIGYPGAIHDLLELTISYAREKGIGLIALMRNFSLGTGTLWKRGFLKKRIKNMVVLPLDKELEPVVGNYDNWDIFPSLHDSL
ncbi:MAG TPA: GNAT family N-acetyltransferase [Bacteroidales bacterium]|nr:GNAT family N-acetyltransferase [Bacteroidales bacterium]